MKWWILFAAVIAALTAGVFLYAQEPHEIKIPGLPRITIPTPDTTGRDEAAQKINEVHAAIVEAKSVRIPLADWQKQLDSTQRLFDERNFSAAKTVATALTMALTAELTKENQKPKIAITFDAGAGVEPAPDLINYLRETRTKITLFSTGKWAEQNHELLKQILMPDSDIINELGNHTYNHPHLVSDGMTDEQISDQIVHTEEIFKNLGYIAKPRFRYPYGERNNHTDAIVTELGYRVVSWSFDSLGWQGQLTPEQIAERVISKIKPNGVVIMHVGSPQDVAAFPFIVERLQSQYRFVFISEL